ncbi:hypothetical protein HPB48_009181 [Haemaphysalis longicornis]|uniref:Uncharacterized protein n=1 Tax=Haemaphysalis longicornis TaxID=44386 RepID=A0A9J6GKD3_HAELO|nr:hypothetical protein HPB48_009181 [Haemaphysalis longicornis]
MSSTTPSLERKSLPSMTGTDKPGKQTKRCLRFLPSKPSVSHTAPSAFAEPAAKLKGVSAGLTRILLLRQASNISSPIRETVEPVSTSAKSSRPTNCTRMNGAGEEGSPCALHAEEASWPPAPASAYSGGSLAPPLPGPPFSLPAGDDKLRPSPPPAIRVSLRATHFLGALTGKVARLATKPAQAGCFVLPPFSVACVASDRGVCGAVIRSPSRPGATRFERFLGSRRQPVVKLGE